MRANNKTVKKQPQKYAYVRLKGKKRVDMPNGRGGGGGVVVVGAVDPLLTENKLRLRNHDARSRPPISKLALHNNNNITYGHLDNQRLEGKRKEQ